MMTGNHDATSFPSSCSAARGGRIKGGRVLDYKDKPERQMCRLYPLDDGQDERAPAEDSAMPR